MLEYLDPDPARWIEVATSAGIALDVVDHSMLLIGREYCTDDDLCTFLNIVLDAVPGCREAVIAILADRKMRRLASYPP